jgi:hypothetical protein
MTDVELIAGLEELRNIMVAVSTGGPRINDVNDKYQRLYATVAGELARRKIDHSLTYGDLWDWYGRWSSGDLPSYQSRRTLVADLFNPLLNQIRTGRREEIPPTGWPRVDRTVGKARDDLAAARTEEQCQAVGLMCRETLISLAQAVFDKYKHCPADGVSPSETDANRMLEAYLATELPDGPTLGRKKSGLNPFIYRVFLSRAP